MALGASGAKQWADVTPTIAIHVTPLQMFVIYHIIGLVFLFKLIF